MDYHQRSHLPPPPYMVLAGQGGDSPIRPPTHRRNLPRYYSHRSSSSCSCRCCCCFCCCFFLLFLVIVVALAAYISLVVKPKVPSYSVDNLSIGGLSFNPASLTIHTKFVATVRAKNPNDMIGIWYKDGSRVMISYRNTSLCSGRLPSFYQGHRNTTVMHVVLEGQSKLGAGVRRVFEENQRTGQIPLDVFVRAPVSLRVFNTDWRQVTVNVTCALVVDGLAPNKKVGIRSADYNVAVDL